MNILDELLKLQDLKYKSFLEPLVPNINKEKILGIKCSPLKALSKEIYKNNEYESFLNSLPHFYHEENMVHMYIINEFKDFKLVKSYLNKFIPYIDNWAVSDSINPKAFKNKANVNKLKEYALELIESKYLYGKRVGIKILMSYFLKENFDIKDLDLVNIPSEEYYLNMMEAWYYATALINHYDEVYAYLNNKKLPKWVNNKTIQKAVESFRISDEHKQELRKLKV